MYMTVDPSVQCLLPTSYKYYECKHPNPNLYYKALEYKIV